MSKPARANPRIFACGPSTVGAGVGVGAAVVGAGEGSGVVGAGDGRGPQGGNQHQSSVGRGGVGAGVGARSPHVSGPGSAKPRGTTSVLPSSGSARHAQSSWQKHRQPASVHSDST